MSQFGTQSQSSSLPSQVFFSFVKFLCVGCSYETFQLKFMRAFRSFFSFFPFLHAHFGLCHVIIWVSALLDLICHRKSFAWIRFSLLLLNRCCRETKSFSIKEGKFFSFLILNSFLSSFSHFSNFQNLNSFEKRFVVFNCLHQNRNKTSSLLANIQICSMSNKHGYVVHSMYVHVFLDWLWFGLESNSWIQGLSGKATTIDKTMKINAHLIWSSRTAHSSRQTISIKQMFSVI